METVGCVAAVLTVFFISGRGILIAPRFNFPCYFGDGIGFLLCLVSWPLMLWEGLLPLFNRRKFGPSRALEVLIVFGVWVAGGWVASFFLQPDASPVRIVLTPIFVTVAWGVVIRIFLLWERFSPY
ncbi:MAG: hypothetical protein Q7S84_03840 [bacterium]|nr:hypothetical protein [bacterium]